MLSSHASAQVTPRPPSETNSEAASQAIETTFDGEPYKSSSKLEGRKAIITGASSVFGRSIALLFAYEGADLTLSCSPEDEDETKEVAQTIHSKTLQRRRIFLVVSDLTEEPMSKDLVGQHLQYHGNLDTLIVNINAKADEASNKPLSPSQLHATYPSNVRSVHYLVQAALPSLTQWSPTAPPNIIMNATTYMKVDDNAFDYHATRGAVIGFCKALNTYVSGQAELRVNTVNPGPIWVPLMRSSADISGETKTVAFPFTYLAKPLPSPYKDCLLLVPPLSAFLPSND